MSGKIAAGVLLLAVSSAITGQTGQPARPLAGPGANAGAMPNSADGGVVPSASMPTYSSVNGTPSGPSNSIPAGVGNASGVHASSVGGGSKGIPATVLSAYERAAALLSTSEPGCRLPVALLAGIGEVESGQARGGRVDANGTALQPILGPVLDGGAGTAAIHDTDHGVLDGNTVWDRAVGPMQFIPSTWRSWGADGNGDGIEDPENVYDAALAAGRYLCAHGRDLSNQSGMDSAILSYNDSGRYLQLVLAWVGVYSGAVVSVADATGLGGPSAPGTSTPDPTTATAGDPPTSVVSPVTGDPTAPPTGPTAPPTSTAPVEPPPTSTQPTPPGGNPVTGLLCGVGNVVGGLLGGLLGQPDQTSSADCPQPPDTNGNG
jgi:hypothetical protein